MSQIRGAVQFVPAKRFILDCDADRAVYLNLLRENIALYGVALIGYCLMSNHVHLIAVPRKADGLAQALKRPTGVMLPTGMSLTADTCGKDDIILARCGARADDESLELEMWRSHWTATAWREYLGAGEMESRLAVIRQRTHTGRPWGLPSLFEARRRRCGGG